MALAAPLMAMLHYQQGRYAEAEGLLTPLLPLIDNTAMHEALAQAYQVLVNTAYLQGQHGRAFELLERAEAMGYNRGWDRLVGTMLLERIRLLVFERRLDEANATAIRIQHLASQAQADPPCARAICWCYATLRRPELPWPTSGSTRLGPYFPACCWQRRRHRRIYVPCRLGPA